MNLVSSIVHQSRTICLTAEPLSQTPDPLAGNLTPIKLISHDVNSYRSCVTKAGNDVTIRTFQSAGLECTQGCIDSVEA